MSEVTENSARLRWERPEPPGPYFYDLTVTAAHDQSLVLRQNLTATDHVVGNLRSGHTYHVTVVCSLRAQVRATYQRSFSTSEYVVGVREGGTWFLRGTLWNTEGTVLSHLVCSDAPAGLKQSPGCFTNERGGTWGPLAAVALPLGSRATLWMKAHPFGRRK